MNAISKKVYAVTLTMAMSIALIQPAVLAAEASKPTAAVAEAITSKAAQTLQQLGYIDGTTDGMQQTQTPITRAQAAIILQRVLKLDTPASLTGFADVLAQNEAAPAIYALKQSGLIQGQAKGYAPDAPLTRAQMASLFTRAFELKDNGIQVVYSDMKQIPAVHSEDAIRLKQHFIIEGSAFNAKGTVTHGEFAEALYLALGLDVAAEGLTPLEDFFKQPAQAGFQMSPDGKHMAYLEPWNNRMNVVVKENGGSGKPTRITSETDRSIAAFVWATDDKLLYVKDEAGDENYHIYVTDMDGKNSKDLTPYPNTRAMLVDPLESIPDEILVGMNKRDPRIFDVYRINIKTGEAVLAAENPGNISGWLTDHEGKIRVAVSSDGNVSSLMYRDSEDKPFEPLLTTELGETFVPLMFTYDNKNIYVASNLDRDKTAIEEFNPSTKKVTKTIYENKDVDVTSFIPSKEKGTILAAVYETDKVNYEFFDDDFKKLMQDLQAKVPGKEVSISNMSEEGQVLFAAYSDKSMGTYYFYDSKTGKLDKLADAAPWIDESKMSDMKPVTYTSRDGLTLHGYLTLPNGAEASGLPLVVVPHGGPWARDSWGFSPEVQFLASRGYAVLQVNFRGSTGYGKAFLDAGNKEWGKAMQNDLTDGVNWLVKEGTVDPERVAIYGGSYGGYAALAGLAFTPDVYAAGISYVGPSNLFTLLDSLPPYWESERNMFYERMGDPVKDKELLTAASPLFHIDQMKAPLFVVQGANDPRVKQAESDQIVEALRERGVDVPYMLKANEGHGFANVENQLDLYRAIEKFLNRHLMQE
ncbi:alpha/beta fold hydrolase [Paenibacillus illinoisensis]|uniref:S9 family peptidase n=1 Tax=Paenibacillus illinoisensis TaxID=59845 RepID=UPI003A4DFD81